MMTQRKHTPGPWTVDSGGIRCGHEHNYGIVAQAMDGTVYSEYTSDSATLEFENIADMHLVAAAPDLYDALTAVRIFLNGAPATPELQALMEKIVAAHRKARGEP